MSTLQFTNFIYLNVRLLYCLRFVGGFFFFFFFFFYGNYNFETVFLYKTGRREKIPIHTPPALFISARTVGSALCQLKLKDKFSR